MLEEEQVGGGGGVEEKMLSSILCRLNLKCFWQKFSGYVKDLKLTCEFIYRR